MSSHRISRVHSNSNNILTKEDKIHYNNIYKKINNIKDQLKYLSEDDIISDILKKKFNPLENEELFEANKLMNEIWNLMPKKLEIPDEPMKPSCPGEPSLKIIPFNKIPENISELNNQDDLKAYELQIGPIIVKHREEEKKRIDKLCDYYWGTTYKNYKNELIKYDVTVNVWNHICDVINEKYYSDVNKYKQQIKLLMKPLYDGYLGFRFYSKKKNIKFLN